MTTANSPASKEVVTAALLVIGGKILSGRTKDQNIGYIAQYLTALHEWLKATGAEMNEARLRMTRIPKGADLILNKVSGAPGFWIGNVIVMAGVPSIMQAMLDEVAPKLKIGVRMLSETVRADAREGDVGMQLGEIAKANPAVAIGSYPFFDPQQGGQHECGAARPRCTEARACKTRGRGDARASAASTIESRLSA